MTKVIDINAKRNQAVRVKSVSVKTVNDLFADILTQHAMHILTIARYYEGIKRTDIADGLLESADKLANTIREIRG